MTFFDDTPWQKEVGGEPQTPQTPPTLIDVDELADDLEALRMIAEQTRLDAADALIRECPIRAWEAVQRLAKAAISFSEDWS
jgi:hypothetical protein